MKSLTIVGLIAAGLFAAIPFINTAQGGQADYTPPARHYACVHTDAQWKKLLPTESYLVLRHADTERPFTGPLLNEHRKGVFVCRGCGEPLFSSNTKFESGTGWPSFYQPISYKNIIERNDSTLGMDRTEVICARCGGHLGHVFDDGPKPTGLRFCMNSAALRFIPSKK